MILLSFREVSLTGADYTNSPAGQRDALLACHFTNTLALESIFFSCVYPLTLLYKQTCWSISFYGFPSFNITFDALFQFQTQMPQQLFYLIADIPFL